MAKGLHDENTFTFCFPDIGIWNNTYAGFVSSNLRAQIVPITTECKCGKKHMMEG